MGIGRGRLEIVLQSTLGREHDIVQTKQTYRVVSYVTCLGNVSKVSCLFFF